MCKQSRMKRISCLLLTFLLCFLAACTAPTPGQTKLPQATEPTPTTGSRPHQELTATEAVCRVDTTKESISIPQIGLENVLLCDAVSEKVALQEDVYGQVYLLGDDRYGNDGLYAMDHYLVIQLGDQLIAKDLLAYDDHVNLEGSIDARDFDGDGYCEILVQECVDMSGGCGTYLTRVFDVKDGQLLQLFSSEDLSELSQNKYGFTATLLADEQYKIEHGGTGYCEVFSLHSDAVKYYADSSAGDGIALEIDSFFEVVADDVDGDDVTELCCTQYSWYAGHADGLGNAKTVWKYNPATKAFEIIRASFEPCGE